MIFYQLDHVVEEALKDVPSPEQVFLKKYLNADFPKKEAAYLWKKILDHKWYVGECLNRDVGLRVAAVDYIENFYEPAVKRQNRRNKKINQNILSPITFAA